MKFLIHSLVLAILCFSTTAFSQDIGLFEQFNGRYDYVAFGNTLNIEENTGGSGVCEILTESSATFSLEANQNIIAAYLYWAGSGPGDFDVSLNGTPIAAERTFSEQLGASLVYFSAFADVTTQLQTTGNGLYSLSNLDISDIIEEYCGNTTNFAGWAITVVYEDAALNLNQVNVFDGLESVSAVNQELDIVLDNLNVLDNENAKIGFLAWEGDAILSTTETLQINGNILSNEPLNPANNAFNSTNSFTNSAELYNMDIDFYNIENNVQPGDDRAIITLTSGQDFVMINNVITVLNNELPDATILLDDLINVGECGNRELTIDYTVSNTNSTDVLPINTPIAFYANSTLVGQRATQTELGINEEENGNITLTIPDAIPADFTLRAVVDDDGTGTGIVTELNENNNTAEIALHLLIFPVVGSIQDLEVCDVFGTESFDLTKATATINSENTINYYLLEVDAQNEENPIATPEAFINTNTPETIWIRVSNPDCFIITSFEVEVIICPLPDATIIISESLNACRGRDFGVPFIAFNENGTAPLPAQTPIAFYANNILVAQSQTEVIIPVGGTETGNITFTLPNTTPDAFTFTVVIDDDGAGNGTVFELNDVNNDFVVNVTFMSIPPIGDIPAITECNEGFDTATFDLTENNTIISTNANDVITFYTSEIDASINSNPIVDPEQYENTSSPQTIYVRLENDICFETSAFQIMIENCPPFIPQGFSPNNDTINDVFEISGILNIYENFNLQIFSREGNLIYTGGNEEGFWNGVPNTGILSQSTVVPVGTYYYVLQLNDSAYPKPFIGFVYINY